MRQCCLIVLGFVAAQATALAAPSPPVPLKAASYTDAQITKVHQAVADFLMDEAKAEFSLMKLEFVRHLGEKTYLVARKGASVKEPRYMLALPNDRQYADMESIEILARKTKEVHEFSPAEGVVLSVAIIETFVKPPILSKDTLITRLKNGETIEFEMGSEEERCKACSGFGRVTVEKGKRDADGKIACKTCKGSGFFAHGKRYLLSW